MKIAFVWDWDNEFLQLASWFDGLAAALRIISKEHSLTIYTQVRGIKKEMVFSHPFFEIQCYTDYLTMQDAVMRDKPEVCLFWADMTRPAIGKLAREFPSAVCFAGGDPTLENAHLFKMIFVESQFYKDWLEREGFPVTQAFGANTELFRPKSQPKLFDAFFPACFADWKRHGLFAEAVRGIPAMACGWFQDHEPWCYEACQKAGVFTTPHMMAQNLPDFYNAAKTVVITSADNGGSQRSVLEAMACNIPVIVMSDSTKTSEYAFASGHPELVCEPVAESIRAKIQALKDMPIQTRQWVLENYSEFVYAKKIVEGLKKICPSN